LAPRVYFCVCVSAYKSICVPTPSLRAHFEFLSPSYLESTPSFRVISLAFSDSTTRQQLFLTATFPATMPSSTKKRTAAKKQQQQHQQPSLSSTKTAPPPLNNSINFEVFITLADVDNIIRFCDAAASTQEGRNLKLFWDRAFEAGLDQGRTEWGSRDEERKESYFRGKAKGIEEAEAAARSAELDLYSRGAEKGRTEERLEWTSIGHGPHCLEPISILSDATIQTDSELSTRTTCDASVHACPPVFTASIQTSTAVDYDSPIDPLSVDNLCSRAATASSNTALGAVWRYAFKAGQDNASQMVDGMQVSNVLKIGFEKGQVHGILQERELWEMAGHSQICLITASSSMTTTDAGTQVNLITPPPPRNNTSVQTIDADIQTSTSSSATTSTQTSVTTEPSPQVSCLDWAEDATSLPILPLLPISSVSRQRIPRDFSSLRSSRPNPFGSLQRRSKQSRAQIASRLRQNVPALQSLSSHYRPPPMCPPSSFLKPQIPCHALKNAPLVSSCISVLDWDQDPRLSDLSRALKALGWIRP